VSLKVCGREGVVAVYTMFSLYLSGEIEKGTNEFTTLSNLKKNS
jgi:hypothetical protein